MISRKEFLRFNVWKYCRPDMSDFSKDFTEDDVIILPLNSLIGINKEVVNFSNGVSFTIKGFDDRCMVNTWYITPEEVVELRTKLNIL